MIYWFRFLLFNLLLLLCASYKRLTVHENENLINIEHHIKEKGAKCWNSTNQCFHGPETKKEFEKEASDHIKNIEEGMLPRYKKIILTCIQKSKFGSYKKFYSNCINETTTNELIILKFKIELDEKKFKSSSSNKLVWKGLFESILLLILLN